MTEVGSWVMGKSQRGVRYVAPGFNPVFKGVNVYKLWPTTIIRRRRLSASKMETDSWLTVGV